MLTLAQQSLVVWLVGIVTEPVALFTLALVVSTVLLWRATLRLAQEARESATDQAEKTERSIRAANKTAAAAAEQAKIAKNTAHRELRAYLCFRPLTIQKIAPGGDRFTITVPLENTGQTPANRLEVQWAWRVTTGELGPAYYDNVLAQHPIADEREHCIGPRQLKELTYLVKITDDWCGKILAGEAKFFFLGKVHYVDAFNEAHITEFFYIYTETLPGRLAQMHVHNRIN